MSKYCKNALIFFITLLIIRFVSLNFYIENDKDLISSICILFFLFIFIYYLISRIVRYFYYNKEKVKSWPKADLIFIITVCFLLVLPVSRINYAPISAANENRILAVYKPLLYMFKKNGKSIINIRKILKSGLTTDFF